MHQFRFVVGADGVERYYFNASATKGEAITDERIAVYLRVLDDPSAGHYTSFDAAVSQARTLHCLVLDTTFGARRAFICNCLNFSMSAYLCVEVLVAADHKGLLSIDGLARRTAAILGTDPMYGAVSAQSSAKA
jgi:hypothetical protein